MAATYRARYNDSHALVIGIDKYQYVGPLGLATADAEAMAQVLVERFGFKPSNVRILLDTDATRAAIIAAFLAFAHDGTAEDDRLVFFFAGHGHTERSNRGEVGFLVPSDGKPDNLASLIRWDELTRSADFIAAKHVLFFMDACYGGLAVKRSAKPGSMRFVKDLLARSSRQVLAAGKADQLVNDSGGPMAGHSPFTGHLLEALSGKAADTKGIMTANGVMAYVYQAVGSEADASQTPHYGQLDGDGDLVFTAPGILDEDETHSTKDDDVLVAVPVTEASPASRPEVVMNQAKEYLSEERHKLRLYELVAEETRRVIALTGHDRFSPSEGWSNEAFRERLANYDALTANLITIQALLGFWSLPVHQSSLVLAPKRLADQNKAAGGSTGWLSFRWHPALLLLYAGGIAAVAAKNYDNLRDLFITTTASQTDHLGHALPFLQAVMRANMDVVDAFKVLPGHERNYAPRSEYLFKLLQPKLDDVLFLGSDYEEAFDRFEVLAALEYAHQDAREGNVWGPPGRFAWKVSRGYGGNPYAALLAESAAQGASWPPLVAGLFGGSLDRFQDLHKSYAEGLGRLGWH